MGKTDDILWKGILENVFKDFLCFLYPCADEIFDFNKDFVFLDKELEQTYNTQQSNPYSKVVDKLAKVFTKNGKADSVLVHIEIQGQYRSNFNRRMFSYYYKIFDKHHKPITAIAVFTEANKVVRTNTFEDEFLGTKISNTFNVCKISHYDNQELLAQNNLFAMVILTAKTAFCNQKLKDVISRDQALLSLKQIILKELFTKYINHSKMECVLNFLRFYTRFETTQMNDTFENELQLLTKQNNIMGIEELLLTRAEERGIEKGMKSGLKSGIRSGIKTGMIKGQKIGVEHFRKNLIKNLSKTGLAEDQIDKVISCITKTEYKNLC